MSFDLNVFVMEALAKTDRHDLIRYFRRVVRERGFTASRYQVLSREFREIEWSQGYRSVDYPQEWLDYYREQKFFDIDPLVEIARMTHEPFYWHEASERLKLTDEQKRYFEDLRHQGFRNGLVVPVYIRPGELAYFSFGASVKALPLTPAEVLEIQIICQVTHQRYEQLLEPEQTEELTAREQEVVTWIMQGKSNAAIAAILGVSNHTIDTLVRRSFRKLGASNRLEASLTAVSRGLAATLPKAG